MDDDSFERWLANVSDPSPRAMVSPDYARFLLGEIGPEEYARTLKSRAADGDAEARRRSERRARLYNEFVTLLELDALELRRNRSRLPGRSLSQAHASVKRELQAAYSPDTRPGHAPAPPASHPLAGLLTLGRLACSLLVAPVMVVVGTGLVVVTLTNHAGGQWLALVAGSALALMSFGIALSHFLLVPKGDQLGSGERRGLTADAVQHQADSMRQGFTRGKRDAELSD